MSGNTRLETPPSLPQEDGVSSSSSISYSSDDLCDEADHLSFSSLSPLLHSTLVQTAPSSRTSPHLDTKHPLAGHAGNGSMTLLPPGDVQCRGGKHDASTSVAGSASSQSLDSSTVDKDGARAATSSEDMMVLGGGNDDNKATLLSSGDSEDEEEYDDDNSLGDERLPSDEEEIELDSEDDNEEDDDSDDEEEDDEDEEEEDEEEESDEKEKEEEKEATGRKEEAEGNEEAQGEENTASEEKEEKSDKQDSSPKEPKPEVSSKGKSKVTVGKKRKRTTTKGRKEKKKKRVKVKKAAFERRNIRKLISENALDAGTLAAQMEERERKRRVLELREKFQQQREQMQPRLSELQSLLDGELDDDPMPSFPIHDIRERLEVTKTQMSTHADNDVVLISSSEEDEEEDNDIVMVQSDHEDEDDGEEDINNSGSHINDEMNQPDAQGRILVNIGHPPDDPDIYLLPQIARVVKPHQIGGIRFLYDNLVEALARYKTSHGFGCVLAHSMGLGKTIQLVAFIDIFLRYTGARHVMVIVPVNTIQNWMYEFGLWTPTSDAIKASEGSSVAPREFDVHVLNDNHRTMVARSKVVNDWYKGGGVLLIGYEMYRLLTSRKFPAARGRKAKTKGNDPVIIDLIEEDQNKELLLGIHEALMRPGPDLVICDEGHRIKNSHAGISKALKNIRTRRRVVLTGYPLQNNLLEYWCMVDFVRPNFLGSRTEFSNMFERPIMNGQCLDSTAEDVRLMRFRAHVLHSLLEGFVQRRGHDVLTATLPAKEEYTLLIRMSPVQRQLYTEFMGQVNIGDAGWVSTNPLKAFAVCCKIWNHPDVLYMAAQKQKKNSLAEDNDIDLEEIQEAAAGTKKVGNKAGKTGPVTAEQKNQSSPKPQQEINKVYAMMDRKEQSVSYEWADELLKNYAPGMLENSGKMVLMMSLIDGAVKVNDKTLIFSQSLFTLNLIEEFLSKRTVPWTETEGEEKEGEKKEEGKKEEGKKWQKNVNYVRLDGSTSGMEREKLINQFNDTDNSAIHVFLLSTRAGCLGINLIGANRVIVFDASWNPCHDSQAVCRVYRYGQFKECFVYRLVTDNTMEKKIYDRQLNKQGISDRVVDELNPQNAFTRRQVDVLLHYQDQDLPHVDISNYLDEKCNDPVLIDTLNVHHPWISREPFCHDRKSSGGTDQKLTKSEKQLARRGYEMEKRLSVNFTRPNYNNFYPKNGPYSQLPPNPLGIKEVYPHNRPIASVPPMMSTPVPRRVCADGQMEAGRFPVQAIMRPGVSVQQILTTTDIIVPGTNSATHSQNSRIPAGENVLVIKTPRGVYLRTRQGKIFAVRTSPKDTVVSVSESTARVTSSASDTTMSGLSTLASMASTSTATSCSTYAVTATAAPTASAVAAVEMPDITDTSSSDETMHEGESVGDTEIVIPSLKPLPATAPIPPSKLGSSTGADKDKPGPEKRCDSDVCITGEKPGNGGASFPGGAMGPPPFYNYPAMYGGYHGMMPPGNMFGTNTGGAGSASEQKNHSSHASPNSYAPLNMPPSDMMFGGYGAPPWLSQITSGWPQHFPDFMQQQQAPATNSQNGRKDGQRKEQREGKEGSDASGSQELFGENTDSVDDSLAAFDSLLGLSNTNASSSDSATTPTTRGSPTIPDWHSGYGMPPYMTYPYGMPTPQSCGMPSGSGASSMGGQMAYMPPLYHSHPSFMSGGYVHSMPPTGMSQPSYNMPPMSAFDAGHSVEKMLHSSSGESHGVSNGSDKDTTQDASTS